jgi:hypothetical protein
LAGGSSSLDHRGVESHRALAVNAEMPALLEAVYREQMTAITVTSCTPRGAILAFGR